MRLQAAGYNWGVAYPDPNAPAILWRLSRGRSTAHATVFPGSQITVTWFIDSVMDRAENYETMSLALARADEIRGTLLRQGWQDVEGS